ncbi:MAG: radical SAM protein [Nitrosopumilales archaeon]|nr:MAG: radical SAM protein [Nitrosopumilales archaeon]
MRSILRMIQVNSSQFNYQYNSRIHFPYSIAMLIGYIKTNEHLNPYFKFEKTFVFRDGIEDYIKQCKNTDILLCSCYVWNWEITTYLANEVKKLNPDCLIIFGGPQVPSYSDEFFEKYPFVDIIVHGEGEHITEQIFTAYLKDKNFSNIKGIQTKKFRNPPASRIDDLTSLPSPYLTNLVWDLVEKVDGVQWVASWETNRGCPYQCTFCDWGSSTATKMRKWSEERLFKEIEWFADNKIPYIDCCDANFGIYQDRDYRLATKIKEEALKKHYPETFRTNWAKFSSEKIIPIAKQLQEVGLLRAVTLSLQSMDKTTLDIIKRENIKFDKFSELTAAFRRDGIPTYTEIIMGLPGETLESFKSGLEIIISDTTVGSVVVYNCGILPNAPMNEPSYREYHKIKSVKSPIFLAHSSTKRRGMEEYEYITISTFSFTLDELKEMYLYAWLIQVFHSLGIFEYISRYYNRIHGLPFMEFYENFLDFCRTQKSLFSKEYEKVVEHANNGYAGKGWNDYEPQFGDANWPIEESSFLRLVLSKEKLLGGIDSFLKYLEDKYNYNTQKNILNDLARFQVFLLTTRDDLNNLKSEQFEFDWKDFIINNGKLKDQPKNYYYENPVTEKDSVKWAWETIWFGRYKQKYKFSPERLHEGKFVMELSQTISKPST